MNWKRRHKIISRKNTPYIEIRHRLSCIIYDFSELKLANCETYRHRIKGKLKYYEIWLTK